VVAGAILVEVVFSWPGVGDALYDAVKHRDYPMLQGGFLLLIVSVVAFNFIADLLYPRIDPRVAE
jgi:ABC-type dipeptide/oligopeptide/nickel transport system permease component